MTLREQTKSQPGVQRSRGTPVEEPVPPRVVIGAVEPEVEGGLFPVKRVLDEPLHVRATAFTDGHDRISVRLLHRKSGTGVWSAVPMAALGNDRYEASFTVATLGEVEYTVEAWIDCFGTWRAALEKKVRAGQRVDGELLEGAALIRAAAERAGADDVAWFESKARLLEGRGDDAERLAAALAPELSAVMSRHPDRSRAAAYRHVLRVQVERPIARAGAWYEFFPRSCAPEPGRHGTFRDCTERLEYIAGMRFDVVYLPPIHPIGRQYRKGPNNASTAGPDDCGSPWAIGAAGGGHKAVHPDLGTLEDFDRLVARARELGLEVALDMAFQCSPDHPYVKEHPEWFRRRPDGTIQYAENPPKRYQDIYPFDFEGPQWRELWAELASVVRFWIGHGVSIFRVDNPHTKPFAFWQWLIAEIRKDHPETVFLSEAFTRPAVMQQLAKLGFSQSYTYFTWRNTKWELEQYFRELGSYPTREFMRGNLFANTPDILHEYLQGGERSAFQIRLTLAATLAGSYGIYGPPFELCVGKALPGTEEYQDSEKYQVRHWNVDDPVSLRPFISRINAIRRQNPALIAGGPPTFLPIDNDELVAYARSTADGSDTVVVVVNLSPHHSHSGWLELPIEKYGLGEREAYQMHDLLGGGRHLWSGRRNFVSLDPAAAPAHVFRLRRRIRTEHDFDYFL